MAELMKTTQPTLPLMYNVSQKVGNGGTNLPEDVALASYMMRLAAKGAVNPRAQQACQSVIVTSSCTPAFIQSIKDLQAALGLDQDGRISPSSPGCTYGGNKNYLIASFNFMVRKNNQMQWPRIDLITDVPTPQQVTALVQRTLIGT